LVCLINRLTHDHRIRHNETSTGRFPIMRDESLSHVLSSNKTPHNKPSLGVDPLLCAIKIHGGRLSWDADVAVAIGYRILWLTVIQ